VRDVSLDFVYAAISDCLSIRIVRGLRLIIRRIVRPSARGLDGKACVSGNSLDGVVVRKIMVDALYIGHKYSWEQSGGHRRPHARHMARDMILSVRYGSVSHISSASSMLHKDPYIKSRYH
jgi:hypothetical protein